MVYRVLAAIAALLEEFKIRFEEALGARRPVVAAVEHPAVAPTPTPPPTTVAPPPRVQPPPTTPQPPAVSPMPVPPPVEYRPAPPPTYVRPPVQPVTPPSPTPPPEAPPGVSVQPLQPRASARAPGVRLEGYVLVVENPELVGKFMTACVTWFCTNVPIRSVPHREPLEPRAVEYARQTGRTVVIYIDGRYWGEVPV